MKLFPNLIKPTSTCSEISNLQKENEKSVSMAGNSSHMSLRCHRKLPSIPPSKRERTFWPTYRSAVEWMNRNQTTIATGIDLLELYPKLIQQKSCDRFWDFITKFAYYEGQNKSKKLYNDIVQERENKQNEDKNKFECKFAPEVFVSRVIDNDKTYIGKPDIPNIYICGDVEDERWQSLVVSLCRKYTIRCSPAANATGNIFTWVFNADIFIFLYDKVTMYQEFYRNILEAAVSCGIIVVYVRNHDLRLPRRSWSSERVSPKMKTENVGSQNSKTNIRSSSGVSFLTMESLHSRSESSSPSADSMNSTFSQKDCHINQQAFKPNNSTQHEELSKLRSIKKMHNTFSTEEMSISTANVLQDEYNRAIVYNKKFHQKCVENICKVISTHIVTLQKLKINSNTTQPDSLVSFDSFYACNNSATNEVSCANSLEPKDGDSDNGGRGTSVGSTKDFPDNDSICDTVFVITNSAVDQKPVVIRWPKENAPDLISNSPSLESFGFQDVDLSQQINKIDLFSGYLSD